MTLNIGVRNGGKASRAQALRRAMIASSSLLTLAAFTAVAQADQQCGAPVLGIVNCSATSYPDGIYYSGFDDLTVNVGEPAGQPAAVSLVDHFIYQEGSAGNGAASQVLRIGKNVTISTDTFGVWQSTRSQTYHGAASARGEVDNGGTITTTASARIGIWAVADAVAPSFVDETTVSSYAEAVIQNTGIVVTGGDDSPALLVNSKAREYRYTSDVLNMTSLAEVDNSGAVTTSGHRSQAISVSAMTGIKQSWLPGTRNDSISGSLDLASITISNSGRLQTSGDDAAALLAIADASGYAETVTGSASLSNTGIVETAGERSSGIELRAFATGRGAGTERIVTRVELSNTGALATHGYGAIGLLVDAESAGVAPNAVITSASVTASNTGSIVTSGDLSYGMLVMGGGYALNRGMANGEGVVSNSGAITTTGFASRALAIRVMEGAEADGSATSTLRATNSGAIHTSGEYGDGIDVSADSRTDVGSALSDIELTNSGNLTIDSANASAIAVSSRANNRGSAGGMLNAGLWVTNSGNISATGNVTNQFVYGILGLARTTGDAPSAIATSNLTNSGVIAVAGEKAAGINSAATSIDAVGGSNSQPTVEAYAKIINTAPVTATGDSAIGLWGQADAVLNDVNGTIASGAAATSSATITNSAAVTVTGNRVSAVLADVKSEVFSTKPAALTTLIDISNSAALTASGANAVAVKATVESVFGDSATGPGQSSDVIRIVNTGSITASGDHATGVAAMVTNPNPPQSGGNIYYISAATVVSSAESGAPACSGICQTKSSSILVTNSGSIVTSGDGSNGVFAYGQSITVDNQAGGVISGGSATLSAGVYTTGTTVIVTNAGRIGAAGDLALNLTGSTSISVTNQAAGTITGFITANSPSFSFTNSGTWIARGDSSFGGRSSIVVNRGTVLAVGGQVLKELATFDNGGLVSLSLANTASGSRARFEEFIVTGDFIGRSGSVLEIGSDMTAKADHLEIDGTISGTTTVKVDALGEPGLTTGNGIMLVDATLGRTTSSNFVLAGNTTAGTLVDGAYEYALGLVPGSAGHGAWYLSSRVYPGVDQYGQLSSSSLLIAEFANGSLMGLKSQDWGAPGAAPPVRVASNDPGFVPGAATPWSRQGFWGSYDRAHLSLSPGGASYGDYRMDVSAGHLGVDAAFDGKGRTLVFGLEYSPVDASIALDKFGSSHIDTNGNAFSGSLVWIEGPWRAAVKYSYDLLRAHFTDGYLGTDARVRLNGYGLQIGGAYEGHLDENTLFQPWLTMSYASVGKAGFLDGAGDTVQLGGTHSTLAALGARIGRTFDLDEIALRPYAELGMDYRFGAKTEVTVGNYANTSTLDGASFRGGGGVDVRLSGTFSFFADVVYVGGGKTNGWQGSVGLRLTP